MFGFHGFLDFVDFWTRIFGFDGLVDFTDFLIWWIFGFRTFSLRTWNSTAHWLHRKMITMENIHRCSVESLAPKVLKDISFLFVLGVGRDYFPLAHNETEFEAWQWGLPREIERREPPRRQSQSRRRWADDCLRRHCKDRSPRRRRRRRRRRQSRFRCVVGQKTRRRDSPVSRLKRTLKQVMTLVRATLRLCHVGWVQFRPIISYDEPEIICSNRQFFMR